MGSESVFLRDNNCQCDGQCNCQYGSTADELLPLVSVEANPAFNKPYWASLCIGETEHYPASRANQQPIELRSPIDNQLLGYCAVEGGVDAGGDAGGEGLDSAVSQAHDTFLQWRLTPAPKRGELVRIFAEKVRQQKEELAKIITLEAGKTWQESLGEVQEVIDVCDFAVGLSRQLHGLTIVSERPEHRMMEQWHPLGVVGVITAFNFPMAVWAWNAALALVCGNSVIWKPSEKTPLCALVCHRLLVSAQKELDMLTQFPALSVVVNGHSDVGESVANHRSIPLVSATGSVAMGRRVAERVASRLGRSLLELGGNNALVVTPNADLDLALKAVVFSAVGTSGQRCTSLRRLYLHESIAGEFIQKLITIYKTISIGDPRDETNLCGPVIGVQTLDNMKQVIADACSRKGKRVAGGEQLESSVPAGGVYINPAIVEVEYDEPLLQQETFAPLMYVVRYESLEDVIAWNNDVPQGLSSAIFTNDMREAERFVSPAGSDCGIANVNIGTSGAEIGGAFGGEKDTGGGRESGSDAWKHYMRRATNTINYGADIPLAQGIRFDL